MLKKIDEFGQDFDKLVCEWKSNLEHSCKKEKVLSTITEVVEEAEMEIIPEGMATINVADIGLTFHSVLSNSHVMTSYCRMRTWRMVHHLKSERLKKECD